uniref:Uncharacterized protein n=1 Tax=Arundo donax TaxID=35708 RepID=A0A0A8YCQ5_ARUDO
MFVHFYLFLDASNICYRNGVETSFML